MPPSVIPQRPSNAENRRIGFTEAIRLPSIHVILKRLVSSGQLIQTKPPNGSTVFVWASAAGDITNEPPLQNSWAMR
jgi:hypothetical protein